MNREERTLVARGARRELALRSFAWFASHVWDAVPMTTRLIPSSAFDALCAALQAVAEGRIKRLCIFVPPGTAKSVLSAVLFPAWVFLLTDGRARVMVGSYTGDFAQRDAQRTRDLIRSDVYRALVDGRWNVSRYPDTRKDFWLTGGGRRVTVHPRGATGERCTVQIIDDPLAEGEIYSQATKEARRQWISSTLADRLENQLADARVLVMQRLCTDDPGAWAIAQGWTVLELPALFGRDANFDPVDRPPTEVRDDAGNLVWRDSRAPGDAISATLNERALRILRGGMPLAMFAAKYLQRPQDSGAAIFHRAYFTRRYAEMPVDIERRVIALDTSLTKSDTSDYACIQCWGSLGEDRYLLELWRKRASYVETLDELRGFIERHLGARILVEAASAGQPIVSQLGREFGEGTLELVSPSKGKLPRWHAVESICRGGKVVLPGFPATTPEGQPYIELAPGVAEFIEEVCAAPNGEHDDQVDAMAYALIALDDRNVQWPDYSALRGHRR
jgi:predicted phage terminase large subunit-like protein